MRVLSILVMVLLAVAPTLGQIQALYRLEQTQPVAVQRDERGVLLVTVRFTVTPLNEQAADVDHTYKVLIKENGRLVKEVPLPTPSLRELATILALDCSGGMKELGKMDQARKAASVFYEKLPMSAEAGGILFDHLIIRKEKLSRERGPLLRLINEAQPRGGTAYHDAVSEAITMLEGVTNRDRFVVLMTDGVDINSDLTLDQVIAQAKKAGVRVYTVGIGEAGKQERVTTVLALDRSGSMLAPADDKDKVLKLNAVKDAALRFVRTIREPERGKQPIARSAVLEFSDSMKVPSGFTSDRFVLQRQIKELLARGETAVLDATYTAIGMLAAENPPGKKAVIALTDGIDNSSRRRPEEVIERAKEAKIPLFMLGFGRKGELDEKMMKQMAKATGGQYYHARNQDELIKVFEDLSFRLNDDGIDEEALRKLAAQTEGKYYHAKNVNELELILSAVTKALERKEYKIDFPSLWQNDDGMKRNVTLELMRGGQAVGGDQIVGNKIEIGYQVRGLVIAEMDHLIYLTFLAGLGLLLALPAGLRRLLKKK